jgi:uncharacterized membrane protein
VAPSLLLADALIGALLVGAIVFAAKRPSASAPRARALLGWVLVAVPLPLVVASHLLSPLSVAFDQAAFIAAVAAFAVGAALLLAGDDRWERSMSSDDPDPPVWWPEFERDFRAYASRKSRIRLRR